MKKFVFGRLVDEENLCNLEKEKQKILKTINNGDNIVIYGPRNFGKTSLVKNIIVNRFQLTHKKNFIFFVDFFNVNDEKALGIRLKTALEHAMTAIPIQKWTAEFRNFTANLRPELSLDPMTGATKISLSNLPSTQEKTLDDIFTALKNLSETRDLLIIFDEFQDIAKLKSAQGVIRGFLQEIKAPVIIMGSKSHLLKEIFSQPKEPFYQWGINVDFQPIDYEVYHKYIEERFTQKGLRLDFTEAKLLQDNLHRVPEAINIVCYEIMESFQNIKIEREQINQVLLNLIESKQAQFEELLRKFSLNEQLVLSAIAKRGSIKQFNSIEFLSQLKMNNKTVANIFKSLLYEGHLEVFADNYRLNDPLLEIFLRLYK